MQQFITLLKYDKLIMGLYISNFLFFQILTYIMI